MIKSFSYGSSPIVRGWGLYRDCRGREEEEWRENENNFSSLLILFLFNAFLNYFYFLPHFFFFLFNIFQKKVELRH